MALSGLSSSIKSLVSSLGSLTASGALGAADNNIFDLSKGFSQSSSLSGYFSVEPFLQSLAANPLMGTSIKNLSSSQLSQVTQLTQSLLGPTGSIGGLDLSTGKPATDTGKSDSSGAASTTAADGAAQGTDTKTAAKTDTASAKTDTTAAADAPKKTEAPKPETPLSKLVKSIVSGSDEIKIKRGDLTQALSLGGQVDNPDEELSLTAQEAATLLKGSPISQLASSLTSKKQQDPLAGLSAAFGGGSAGGSSNALASLLGGAGGSASNPLAALLGGAGGSSSNPLAALLGGAGGSSSNPLAALLGGAGGSSSNPLAALLGGASGGKNPLIPSLADIYDLPTLGRADSMAKLAKLGNPTKADNEIAPVPGEGGDAAA